MKRVIVGITGDQLCVSFKVDNCLTGEMKTVIHQGIPTIFTFFVIVEEERAFWWDRTVSERKVTHEIRYDKLKRLYTVYLSEKGGEPVSLADFDRAKEVMAGIKDLKAALLRDLIRGKRYEIRMMAELEKTRLPFYLHYLSYFFSFWEFKTDWKAVDFVF